MAVLTSPVWGDVPRTVTATHGQPQTWGTPGDYQYSTGYGMDGKSHPGVDVSMTAGTPLRAIRAGKVAYIRQEETPTRTREVVIEDDRSDRHLYTHTSRQSVTTGDTVTAGQVIAHSGDPGSGAHLHFEHRVRDSSTREGWRIVDPVPLLTGASQPQPQPSGPYRPTSPVLGETLGTPDQWIAWAETAGVKRLPDFATYAREVYRLCRIAGPSGPQAHKLIAQWHLETGAGTSRWWVERLNPAGLGITGDPKQNEASKVFLDGVDAARAHFHHAYQYATWPLPEWVEVYRANNPRADAVPVALRGTKETLQDFGSTSVTTWAYDDQYGAKWAARLNQLRDLFAGAVTPEPEPQPEPQPEPPQGGRGMKAWQFVGLSQKVWLPDHIIVEVDIVGTDKCNWVRSCVPYTGQTKTTFHDTGHAGSTARGQRNYLHGGPRNKDGSRRKVGFNFAVDDTRIIQLTPLNEVTWAAGTETGNAQGWHVEMCFGGSIDFDRSLANAIALHGGIIAAKGWSTDTALVQHRYWSGKYCPGQILNRGMWPQVVARVSDAAAKAKAAAVGGQAPPPQPQYQEPVPIPELAPYKDKPQHAIPYRVDGDGWTAFAVFDRVKATKQTPRYRYASGGADRVGPDIAPGLEFDVSWLLVSEAFPDTYLSPYDTRIRAGDTARVADVVPTAVAAEGPTE